MDLRKIPAHTIVLRSVEGFGERANGFLLRLGGVGEVGAGAQSRPRVRRPAPGSGSGPLRTMGGLVDFRSIPRSPYSNLDVVIEVQRLFRAQGVEQVLIYQGTQDDHLLAEFVTNSETSVFRSLKVAAGALLHLRENYPNTVSTMEMVLSS